MLRVLVAVAMTLIGSSAVAGQPALVASLVFMDKKEMHRYSVYEDSDFNKSVKLHVGQRRAEALQLNSHDLDRAYGNIVELFWEIKYKPNQSSPKCNTYAYVKIDRETATICREKPNHVGKAMGILNQLHAGRK